MPTIARGKQDIRGVVEQMWINWREHDWLSTVRAKAVTNRNGRDVFGLSGAPVETRDLVSTCAVDDVGIKRVRRDVAVLDHADRMPIAIRDLAVVATARNTN